MPKNYEWVKKAERMSSLLTIDTCLEFFFWNNTVAVVIDWNLRNFLFILTITIGSQKQSQNWQNVKYPQWKSK